MIKTFIAAAAVSATVAGFSATTANAGKFDVDVDVYLDAGYGSGHGYGYPIYDEPDYHHPRPRHHWRISCQEGAWSVRNAGYRKVRVNECDGKTYTYTGKRYGERYVVKVSAKTGYVIGSYPVY